MVTSVHRVTDARIGGGKFCEAGALGPMAPRRQAALNPPRSESLDPAS